MDFNQLKIDMRYKWFCLLRWAGLINYPKPDNSDLINLLQQCIRKTKEANAAQSNAAPSIQLPEN